MSHPTPKELANLHLKQAFLLVEHGHIQEAYEAVEQAKLALPDHPLPPTIAASFLIAQGEVKSAISALYKILKKWPKSAGANVYMAEACWLDGRLRKAQKHLKQAALHDEHGTWQAQIEALEALCSQIEKPSQIQESTETIAPTQG